MHFSFSLIALTDDTVTVVVNITQIKYRLVLFRKETLSKTRTYILCATKVSQQMELNNPVLSPQNNVYAVFVGAVWWRNISGDGKIIPS